MSLSTQLHIPEEEAKELLQDFYETFNGVQRWKYEVRSDLLRFGYVKTYLGRRRSPVLIKPAPRVTANKNDPEYERQRLSFVWWKHAWLAACYKSHFDPEEIDQEQLEQRSVRQAVNFTIQGSVAEVTNFGMLELYRHGWPIVAQVHDEILLEVEDNPDVISKLTADIKRVFQKRIPTRIDPEVGVLFKVDVGVGKSWAAK